MTQSWRKCQSFFYREAGSAVVRKETWPLLGVDAESRLSACQFCDLGQWLYIWAWVSEGGDLFLQGEKNPFFHFHLDSLCMLGCCGSWYVAGRSSCYWSLIVRENISRALPRGLVGIEMMEVRSLTQKQIHRSLSLNKWEDAALA